MGEWGKCHQSQERWPSGLKSSNDYCASPEEKLSPLSVAYSATGCAFVCVSLCVCVCVVRVCVLFDVVCVCVCVWECVCFFLDPFSRDLQMVFDYCMQINSLATTMWTNQHSSSTLEYWDKFFMFHRQFTLVHRHIYHFSIKDVII